MNKKEINFADLKKYIVEVSPKADLWLTDEKIDLIEVDAIDSLNIIELIALLEEKFKFSFNPKDITAENFKTIENLLNLLKTKYGFQIN